LNRSEVVSLFKQVLEVCGGLGEQAIMMMPPNADDVLSSGYQIHIKPSLRQADFQCIQAIVQKHNLSIINEPTRDLTVIFRQRKL
jgi:hypothetical protein